jgi:hypothetical protein
MRVRLRWDSVTFAVLAWIGLLTGIAVHAHLHPATHTVFDIYAQAARNWWAGRDLYVRQNDYFRYSPLLAISFTPFAVLPDAWGTPLWKVFNCAFFAVALGIWSRRILPKDLSRSELAALFSLVLPLSMHSMYIGQANMMMLGAMLLALAAAAEGRWSWSAGWLAWATLIKGYPLALGALLAAQSPRRFAPRFALAIVIGLLLPFAGQAPATVAAQYRSWFDHLGASTSLMPERSRSLDHLLATYHHALSPRVFSCLGLLTGAIVLGLILARRPVVADPRQRLQRSFLLFVFWLVLFGPAVEACTYAVTSPVVSWELVNSFRRRTSWALRSVLIASLLLMGPLVTDAFGPAIRRLGNEQGFQPIGALLFVGYVLLETLKRRGQSFSLGIRTEIIESMPRLNLKEQHP